MNREDNKAEDKKDLTGRYDVDSILLGKLSGTLYNDNHCRPQICQHNHTSTKYKK